MHRQEILATVGKRISSDRNETHGDPQEQLAVATKLKDQLPPLNRLSLVEREALSLILTKVSRIACGQPVMDHWEDIAGYAAIAAESRSSFVCDNTSIWAVTAEMLKPKKRPRIKRNFSGGRKK